MDIGFKHGSEMALLKKESLPHQIVRDLKRNKLIYVMLIPVVAYFIIFAYAPMYGNLMAFTDYNPAKGIWGSKWVGLQQFSAFFNGYYFGRIVGNTLLLGFYDLLFGFPAPILLALLVNEIRNRRMQKLTQTISYLPHFVSTMIVVGMLFDFLARDGLINNIISLLGGKTDTFMIKKEYFRSIFVASNIWQNIGWESIIFFAAITGIDQTLYEAAITDGAGRFQRALHITLPGILPTIIIMLIFRIGGLMNVSYEKVLLMQSPITYDTSDIIYTYIYRKGILGGNYGYTAAVGLFNSAINFVLLLGANGISRRVSGTKLW